MRCRELKKKCDNALPSCTRCSEFGAKCLYLTYEEYQQSLGETVVRLGRQLDEMQSYLDEMNEEQQKYDAPLLWDGYESPETIEFYHFLWKTRQDYAKDGQEVVLAEYDEPLQEKAVQWHATLGAGGIMIETDIQTFGDLYRVLKSQQSGNGGGLCA
ncbi:hypothetical protein DFQ28_008170 [Apophysomyces sp. BC1034]